MVEHLDQDEKLERRTLRAANELFLKLLQAERDKRIQHRVHRGDDHYDAEDDFARSIEEAYRVIRARVANGGKRWEPP